MNISVWIEPHERFEAMEAYRQWLNVDQEAEITDAPDGALIRLERSNDKTTVQLQKERPGWKFRIRIAPKRR